MQLGKLNRAKSFSYNGFVSALSHSITPRRFPGDEESREQILLHGYGFGLSSTLPHFDTFSPVIISELEYITRVL